MSPQILRTSWGKRVTGSTNHSKQKTREEDLTGIINIIGLGKSDMENPIFSNRCKTSDGSPFNTMATLLRTGSPKLI